jgi:hypothetical protein
MTSLASKNLSIRSAFGLGWHINLERRDESPNANLRVTLRDVYLCRII